MKSILVPLSFVKSSDRAHKICYGRRGTGIDLNGIAYVNSYKNWPLEN